ncbi:MAG: NAD(P)H-hydrate dehydratase, partial [Oscillospiraceae bacterium]|nr:NAD(P)H-hydrate dehydratase [Oscillospiraceae bacterium]
LPGADVIIDAIFGVGLNKPAGGRALAAIEAMNRSALPIIAADVPSGVEADTGRVLGAAVHADVTVTFSLAKAGLFAEPGCVCAGEVRVADIGIPPEILEDCEIAAHALTDADARLPRRSPLSHKGDYGKLLILGGSAGFTGAPTLCARAAVRAGAGLVYLGVPAPIYEITAVKNDEAMPFPLPEGGMARAALEKLKVCGVCAAGPGLGRSREAEALAEALLADPEAAEKPMVLDADALNALAGHLERLRARKALTVLTPHEGEFLRLGGALTGDRVADARRFATELGCVLLLKGHRCVAAFPDGKVFIATRGNPGMAKGGSGDTLTGILAAMLGQFPADGRRAVLTGMALHALAGDLCRDRLGEYAMTASDLIETLPEASKYLMEA